MRIDISNRIGTTSNFGGFRGLLDKFSGAAAGYSLRKLSKSATNAVRVRRSSDNTEQDIGFTGTELDTTTLLDFVNARDVAPADYGAGAAAAYSLRYVSDSYTGSVVRVRRDSDNAEADFTPSEITDGTLLAWVGNTASDNGYVTTWYDQSGNSNDATQGTAASQPKIVDAGVLVEENGKPSISFDGVNDLLDIGQSIDLYSLASEWSVFMDAKVIDYSLQSFQRIIFNDSSLSTPDIPFGIQLRDNNDVVFFNNANVDTLTLSSATQRNLFSFIKRSTDVGIGINSIFTTGTKGATDFTTGLENTTIGCSPNGTNRPAKMKSAEIIIYTTDQSSNRGNIEANVNDYYSIYTSTNDGFVTTWYDQAGSNDATQATAANQPQIVDGGSLITENGKVAVQFDGVDDYIDINGSSFSSLTQPFTLIHTSTLDSNQKFAPTTDGITAEQNRIVTGNGSVILSDQIFAGIGINATVEINQALRFYIFNSTSSEYFRDGTSVASGNAGLNNPSSGLRIAADHDLSGTNYANINMQEIIIYPSDQSGNRTAIEGNINKNYQMYWDGAGYSLLDNFAGAEAAYALKPLSSTYRGAIVKVRRSSDNAERDIYANYDGTLDTASLLDFCSGTDGYVSVWYDQSGNGNNAVQSTASAQPKIVSGGSLITPNGYTVIQYDGSDDNLTTSFTATGTMLMGGADGGAFYEVSRSGSYNLLASASLTDHPLKESIRVIWGRTLSAGEQSAIESRVTYSDWDFSDVTNFERYWRQRAELTSFPLIDTSNGVTFVSAWRNCTSLTSFPLLDVSSGTNFRFAWYNCSSLQNFPANMFDSVTATDFTLAFDNTNLTQISIDNILVSLDTAGQSGGTFDQSGGSAPSATGEAAIDNLRARGWTVSVTGGY